MMLRVYLSFALIFFFADQTTSIGIVTPINAWHKFACTPESIKAHNTYYCDKDGHIHCLPGWSVESKLCQVPICQINGSDCVYGNCSRPFTCDCEVGWTGQFCEKCVTTPGCAHGYCNRSFECICKPGWKGMFCNRPVCDDCDHGECLMPGMCVCHEGWSGRHCDRCEDREDCQFGRCIGEPFECVCYDGYYGNGCDQSYCREGCHPKNGFCMMPDTCWCRDGWTGYNCDECIPRPGCVNGSCNLPWECNCQTGFFGRFCNETQNINGNWGEWSNWTNCSVTCGRGIKNRYRHCDNPTKSGNGTYCSTDGSSSSEIMQCTGLQCPTEPPYWNDWSRWGPCSVTCGNGTGSQQRTRTCQNGPTSLCTPGNSTETRSCNSTVENCPIDGNYTDWGNWGPCNATCVGSFGIQARRRTCTNPTPQYEGRDCGRLGPDRQQIPCNGTTPYQNTSATSICYTISQ